MAIGSVGSSPDFTPPPAPEMEASAPVVESNPSPIVEEAPAVTSIQDSASVSSEAQRSDSVTPFSSISDSQDSHLEAMRSNFAKPADRAEEAETKSTIDLAPSLAGKAEKSFGEKQVGDSLSPKVQSFQEQVSRLDAQKSTVLEPNSDQLGDGVETLKSELAQADKQKDENLSNSDERVRKDSLKLDDIRGEIARREAYQANLRLQPDTRFRGDLTPQSWDKEAQQPEVKPATPVRAEASFKSPFSSNPWENSVLKGISALGPLSERTAKLAPPVAEAPVTKPEPLPGLLKPSERSAGPDTRLPGDQSHQIPAGRTEEKAVEESPAKEDLPQVLERLDALSRSVSSQFSSLSDKFQLSLGKLGELRSNPLTPPVPGQWKAVEDSARKSDNQPDNFLSSAGKALLGPVGSSLLSNAGDWLKETFTTKSDSLLGGAGDWLKQTFSGDSKSLLGNASDWLKQTFTTDSKGGSNLLGSAGDWLKQTFSSDSQNDSLLSSASKLLIGPVGSSLLGGAGDWLKETFTTKTDSLMGSVGTTTSNLLGSAGNWLKQTFSSDSQNDSLLSSASKLLIGPVGSSLLGGAGDWLKETFTTKTDSLMGSAGTTTSSLLAGAGNWLKQTFSSDSQNDSLLGSASRALLGPVGSSLLSGAGDWLKETFTTKTDSLLGTAGTTTSSLLAGAGDWLKQTFSNGSQSDSLLGSASRALLGPVGSSLLSGAGDWLKETFTTKSDGLLGSTGSNLLGGAGDWLKQTFSNSQSDGLLGAAATTLLGPVGSSLLGGAGELLKQGGSLLGSTSLQGENQMGPVGSNLFGSSGDLLKQGSNLGANLFGGSNAELTTGSSQQAVNWVTGFGAQSGILASNSTQPSLSTAPQASQFKTVEAWAEATQDWAANKSQGMTPASLAPANFSNLNAWSSAVENFQTNKPAPAETAASPLALPEIKTPWQPTQSLAGPSASAPAPQMGPVLSEAVAPVRVESTPGQAAATRFTTPSQSDQTVAPPLGFPAESRSLTSPATSPAGGALGPVGSASVSAAVSSEKAAGSGGSPAFLGGSFRQPEPQSNPSLPDSDTESLSLASFKTNLESVTTPNVAQSLGASVAARNASQTVENSNPTAEAELAKAERLEPAFALKRTAFSQQRDHQRDSNRSNQEEQKSSQSREEKEKEEKHSSSTRNQKSQDSETNRKQQAPAQQQRQTPQQRLAQQQAQAKKQASSHRPKSGWSAEDQTLEKQAREACGQCGHQIDGKGSACLICSSAPKVQEYEELVA